MRFGKLLAAVTQNSPANEPYISYKELKHNISKVSVVCSGKDEDNSSGDDGALQQEILESYAASSSSSVLAASSNPKIVGPQQDFFSLLDQDLTAAQLYVQSNVSDVEAMLGEWQVAAVKAGLIFTPQQLEEVQRQLPVHMEEEALVDWLLSLTPGAKTRAARFALVDKYSDIARPLNSLLQYVEVNLTAVRKILKKFDKKIPPEFRMQKASDYKVHHELFTPPGAPAAKRRKLDDDDGENEGESEEEPVEPELPGGELPELGSTRPWDLVICDEAHRMKNMSSLLAKSLRGLKSRCRILLTGTPVQNALQDLWALMDFAQPGLLGNHATFVKTFSDPIDRGSVRGAKVWAVELKKHLAEQLRALIAPHLLRRTKTSAGIMGDASEVDAEDVDMEVFRAIGLLKRLCNHPLLLLQIPKVKDWAELLKEVQDTVPQEAQPEASAGLSEPSEVEPADEVLAGDAEAEAAAGDQAVPSGDESGEAAPSPDVDEMLKTLSRSCQEVLQQSAKLRCLSKLLPDLAAKGHRTLVFSQSVKMLDLVQICCLKPNGLRCLRIDGLTEAQARAEKVAKFNNQPERFQCMLLTTAVGGVGLNLTAADRVVLVDPAWNPATDAQAVDRAYRIGQTKEVRVYRLIMSGLVEDKMFRLQVFKMGLTRTALEADQQHRYFTSTEPAVTKAAVQATTPVPLRPQQAGLVSREEEEEEDEVPEGQELAGKPRRRGGRNRKRGSRKDFEKSDAQPPQPAGKGKAKGQVQKEAAVSAGPSPCDSPPNAKPSPTTMVRAAMPMQMPLMHMAYPRLQPMYGGLPVFFPKAGQGKGPEPLIIGGPPGTLVDGNWFSMPMMWPQ